MQIYGPALYLIVGNMAPEEGTEALAKVGILIFIIITTSTMIIKTIMIITSNKTSKTTTTTTITKTIKIASQAQAELPSVEAGPGYTASHQVTIFYVPIVSEYQNLQYNQNFFLS